MPGIGISIGIYVPRVPVPPAGGGGPSGSALLLETSGYLLLENGSFLLLE